jgi:hypothetical protein
MEEVIGFVGSNIKGLRLPDVVLYSDGLILAQHRVDGPAKQMLQREVSTSGVRLPHRIRTRVEGPAPLL